MTMSPGLKDVSVEDFEFFTPSIASYGDHVGADANAGLPGQDPYPRVDRSGSPRLMQGEQELGWWTARTLHRGLMYNAGTPKDWATGDGEWLREEFAGLGKIGVVLTDLRLLITIPHAFVNDQMYERTAARCRGEGPAVRPTIKDRALIGSAGRLARGSGPIGRFVRELLGDLPPIAGHMALENVRAVTWPESDTRTPVVVQAVVTGSRGGRVARPATKFLALELDVGQPAARELGGRLADAIRARAVSAEATAAEMPRVAPAGAGAYVYEPSAFRAIGSADATRVV